MGIRRTKHAVYDLKYHLVWVPKYRVHIFIEAPPRYSPSELVKIMKSISAREIFKKFRRVKKQMWSGEIWNDGYFVRSVGDRVTSEQGDLPASSVRYLRELYT